MGSLRHATVLVASVASIAVVGSAAAHPPQPTSRDQALSDGCQRSDFGIGFDTSPEWVYVYRSPAIRMASGVVRVSHASLEDSVLEHHALDYNGNLVPDASSRYLIAGSAAAGTNNFGPTEGESYGRLHFEWEGGTMPLFVWPSDGDRATLWGSWIWDCGHWTTTSNNTGGTIAGEHSELHPLSAIVVSRRTPYLAANGENQSDAFISNEGNPAHAIEQCALSHQPATGAPYPQYDSGFKPCARFDANDLQPLAPSYKFFVAAPPKPAPGALLRWHVMPRVPSSGSESISPRANGIDVTVKLHGATHVVRYGKTFLVSWSMPPAHKPAALKVALKSVTIIHADPNPAVRDPSGANWNLYLDVNGYWQLINNWAPRLTTGVVDGEKITINRTVKIYVPKGRGVSVLVQGRECDEPAGKTVLGVFTNLLYPCPANTDEQNPNILDIFANDDPGTILTIYHSAHAALGTHTATAQATVRFPGTGSISFGNGVEGSGNYQLTYSIKKG